MDLPIAPLSFPAYPAEALSALYRRGTLANTLRAWERDLTDLAA